MSSHTSPSTAQSRAAVTLPKLREMRARGEKIVRICLLPVSHVFSSFTASLRAWQFPKIGINPRNVDADHRSKDGLERRAALVSRLAPDLQEKIV